MAIKLRDRIKRQQLSEPLIEPVNPSLEEKNFEDELVREGFAPNSAGAKLRKMARDGKLPAVDHTYTGMKL